MFIFGRASSIKLIGRSAAESQIEFRHVYFQCVALVSCVWHVRWMTVQEKTAAIKKIMVNHQDNQTAIQNADVDPGLQDLVVEALNRSVVEALVKVFANSAADRLRKG